MTENQMSKSKLMTLVVTRFIASVVFLGALFFLPAGTFNYWQAWLFSAIIFIPVLFVLFYLLKNDSGLLERRMRTKEPEKTQRLVIALSTIPLLAAYLLPGFDIRFGWSHVPVWMVIAADVIVLIGYLIVFLVFKENRYTSRVVEVEKEQTVISSGPYSLVRHPMYSGVTLMYVFSPLALGSYWAMLPALLIIPVLAARMFNEEKVLSRDLKGYPEYMQKVKYRLIPGVW